MLGVHFCSGKQMCQSDHVYAAYAPTCRKLLHDVQPIFWLPWAHVCLGLSRFMLRAELCEFFKYVCFEEV